MKNYYRLHSWKRREESLRELSNRGSETGIGIRFPVLQANNLKNGKLLLKIQKIKRPRGILGRLDGIFIRRKLN